ncbi:MAG: hypothetical protein MUF03_05440 [Rubrivivax sp.]|jgi:hypothetical protein|nr:hypothetical protein [Rubrivivax sp.]
MYEIWLALNILWEIALDVWPLIAAGALLWAVLMATAARRSGRGWGRGLPLALGVGLLVAVAAFALLPGLTRSSLGELRYWVDWANLLMMAAGFGAIAAAFAWPLASMRGKPA